MISTLAAILFMLSSDYFAGERGGLDHTTGDTAVPLQGFARAATMARVATAVQGAS
jgi:hypothetical protein